MTSQKTLKQIEKLVWIFIYGGLLPIVLGIFVHRYSNVLAYVIQALGCVFVTVGLVLFYVRTRLKLT